MALAIAAKRAPTFREERRIRDSGATVIAGLDEVGRGSWAGPLAVCAAIVPEQARVRGVRDSKMLTEERREVLYDRVANWCASWSVGFASPQECDELGMTAAQRLASARAIDGLAIRPDHLLVDGPYDFVKNEIDVTPIVKGDRVSVSIAAASILAKVTRDRLMREAAESFPAYDFAFNKGYPCPRHKRALTGYGPTAIHRKTWGFMDYLPWPGMRVPGFATMNAFAINEEADQQLELLNF